jgi:hypothetical protein
MARLSELTSASESNESRKQTRREIGIENCRRTAPEHDIVSISPGDTRDGRFLPNGIRWGVERLFA